jgi:hypothetical protein
MHVDALIVPSLAPMCNVLSEVNVKSRIKWKVVLGQVSHLEWRKFSHMEPPSLTTLLQAGATDLL